jgi:ectoine hydroxylase-related dioxygenase (phytanoyl-CoA dioxygenase family)
VLRELNQRHGANVFEVKGDITTAPQIAQDVIAGLHDHLARRTINNPDIAHRIEHLGLTERVAELDRDGYTILEGAFSTRWADELAAELRRLIAEGPKPNLAAALLVSRGEMFEEAAVHPWVLTLAEYLVGRGCILSQLLAFSKTAGIDTHSLHTDYPLVAEPYPSYCWSATCIWALEDFTETSGPTVVVPGSFREDHHPDPRAEVATKKILMPKGSIAMWHGATWHAAAVREDPGERLTLHNTYTRLFARAFDNYRDIDRAVLKRNSPALSTLCGLDDPFEKNTFAGPAREPLNYARTNYSATGF